MDALASPSTRRITVSHFGGAVQLISPQPDQSEASSCSYVAKLAVKNPIDLPKCILQMLFYGLFTQWMLEINPTDENFPSNVPR